MVYLLINRHRSYENISYITIGQIFRIYGYKQSVHKPKAYYEVIAILEHMAKNQMVAIRQDINKISYDTCIELTILPNFGCRENYTIINASQLDAITSCDTNISKDNLLLVFLYIRSYIIHRPKYNDGSEMFSEPYTQPEAFYRNMNTMAEDIGMSKNTIIQCLEYLASPTNEKALLRKKEPYNTNPDEAPPMNIPNIYVLNKPNWEWEAEWAYKKLSGITK